MIRQDNLPLEKHNFCPKGRDSWCKFWLDKLDNTNIYDDKKRLPEVFMDELNPIFERLSSNELLSRCLEGLTQNQNESVNGMLWSKCSKNKFCGVRQVRTAVCETIGVFNTGAASNAGMFDKCGIHPGASLMQVLRKEDSVRVQDTARKVSIKYRQQRQKLRWKRKSKADKLSIQGLLV